MRLDAQAREFYVLAISLDPPVAVTAWEASFDGGATWAPAVATSGRTDTGETVTGSGWLLTGPDCGKPLPDGVPATTVAPPTEGLQPKIRLVDDPEVVVRRVPKIYP